MQAPVEHVARKNLTGKAVDPPLALPAQFAAGDGCALIAPEEIDAALAGEWGALAALASEPNPFAEHWFVAPGIGAFPPNGGMRLAVVRRGARLAGILPLFIERDYGRARIAHVENWRHPNMFLGTPLVRSGEEEPFWRALIETLDGTSWARGFLHVDGLAEDGPVHRGLKAASAALGRRAPVVYRERRALLEAGLSPEQYLKRNLRKKRRDEFKRLRKRLGECGRLETRELGQAEEIGPWCQEFLRLEAAGWKGRAGSALACCPSAADFFRRAVAGAFAAGRLHFLRLDLDRRPIAMLTGFLAPPGAFGFKTAFDEAFARFSPGVLLQLDYLAMLERPGIEWTDSCAGETHPTASLWSGRRSVVRITLRLKGMRRGAAYLAARALEQGATGLARFQAGRQARR
ncbi:MAG: GNAT family N-acetyltransferase [Sphingomonadaceae bacterium]